MYILFDNYFLILKVFNKKFKKIGEWHKLPSYPVQLLLIGKLQIPIPLPVTPRSHRSRPSSARRYLMCSFSISVRNFSRTYYMNFYGYTLPNFSFSKSSGHLAESRGYLVNSCRHLSAKVGVLLNFIHHLWARLLCKRLRYTPRHPIIPLAKR